jgi:hypothetical protein
MAMYAMRDAQPHSSLGQVLKRRKREGDRENEERRKK